MDTNAEANYKVSFGRAGGTLVYEDDVGFLLFTFDCGPADKQSGREWNLHLGTRALVDIGGRFVLHNASSEWERVAAALERVRLYASSCGYVVLPE